MALRFTTTRLSGLRAAGRTGDLQHALIAPFLQRELGSRHGRFLAEFEPEGSDHRAWYAEAEALPRRVADMPVEEQAAPRAAAGAIVADIRALAERLAGGSAQQANLARVLLAATAYPEEDLWCDGDQPIAVNWGFAREDRPDVVPRAVTGLAPPLPPAVSSRRADGAGFPAGVAASPVFARLGSFAGLAGLLWFVFVALVLSIDRLLLPACGIDARWFHVAAWGRLDACAGRAATDAAVEEGLRLQALVRQAELQLAQSRQACAVPGRRTLLAPDRAPESDGSVRAAAKQRAAAARFL